MKQIILLFAALTVISTSTVAAPFEGSKTLKQAVSNRMSHNPSLNRFNNKGLATKSQARKKATEMHRKVMRENINVPNPYLYKKSFASEWNGEEWYRYAEMDLDYNDQNLIVTETQTDLDFGSSIRTDYEYDKNGMPTLELITYKEESDSEFINNQKETTQYDPIVTDLIIDNAMYYWEEDTWVQNGNNYRRVVTRNIDNNVVEVVISVLLDGIYDPVEKIQVTYGADKKATDFVQTILTIDENGEYVWEPAEEYHNMVWVETDGQLVVDNGFCSGANRMAQAVYWSEGEEIGLLKVTYNDNGYVGMLEMDEDGAHYVMKEIMTRLDAICSYTYETNVTVYIDNEAVYNYGERETVKGDSYYLLTESKYEVWEDGETEIWEWNKGLVTYDDTYGYPLSYIQQTNMSIYYSEEDEYDGPEWENIFMLEFEDYFNASAGVAAPELTPVEGIVKYYDLQGNQISNPTKGLYIRVNGSKSEKILL